MSLRPSEREEIRRSSYKVTVGVEDARRQREDALVEIRKNKREKSLLKKRLERSPPLIHRSTDKKWERLPALIASIYSHDSKNKVEGTAGLYKLLSIGQDPPINQASPSGVLPRFVEFLRRMDNQELQSSTVLALSIIAAAGSETTMGVINSGAVPILVQLLRSPNNEIREQVLLALGHIACDSAVSRDHVLSSGAMLALVEQLNEHTTLSMLRNASWTLAVFCRNKPVPDLVERRRALLALQRIIRSDDEQVLTDACRALYYLSDGSIDQIQDVIEAGVIPHLVELLKRDSSSSVLILALRTIGNIVSGGEKQAQCIIDNQALPHLFKFLTQIYNKSIEKEACWVISNITAGSKDHIQAVIAAGFIAPLLNVMQTAELEVKTEAAWAIANAMRGGGMDQIRYLVGEGCIKPLCNLLVCPHPKTVMACLGGLEMVLKAGDVDKFLGQNSYVNPYALMIVEAEGLYNIENLQTHDNIEIYRKALNMLETYWPEYIYGYAGSDEMNDD